MAVNIGPKIGIDGEKKYRDSITNIIQQQKTLKSEMKETASSWDKNTSEMKKATQQSENLSKQIEVQEKRVSKLNEMLEMSSKKYGENDTRTLQWKEKLSAATAELNNMKHELADLPNMVQAFGQDMQAAGDKVSGIGDKITGIGKGLSTHVTAPLAAVGGLSVAAFNEVDEGMDTIIAKTGATGDALEGMQTVFENIATSIPTDFATAGEAVGEVATRFQLTGQELEDLTSYFIKFADVNKTDVTQSIDSAQKALSAFGLDATSATGLLDTLNTVGQNTGASMDSLLNGLIQNGTAFQEMGLSIEQAAVFMGQMETSGANSETVMQGLRKALKDATAEGIPLDQALSDLQNTILNGTDSVDGLTAAYDLFGKSGDQIYAAVKNGTLSFTDLATAAVDSGGSVEDAFNAMLDPTDQAAMTMNELKLAGAELGSTLLEIAVPAITKLTDIVKDAKNWWDSLDGSTKENIVRFGLLVAAIGPVVAAVGTVISTVGSVISIGGTLVSGIGTVIAVLGGPLTAAIGAAVAAGVLIYKNWDTLKAGAIALYNTIKEKFEAIKTSITQTFESVKKSVSDTWENIKKTISDAIEKIKGFLKFDFKLPDLKLPHIKYDLVSVPVLGTIPDPRTLRVEWYAKAMENGMILRNPTIFGAANGHFLGAGEAGPEVVVGASSLFNMIRGAVASTTNNYGGNNVYVYGAPGQDVHDLAREIANIINADVQAEGAVW